MRSRRQTRKTRSIEARSNIPLRSLVSVCRRQGLSSSVTRRFRRRDRIETKAISMKATRCSFVRSKIVCVLQTYMGKEFNVNGQTV
jgi:hypothetical protein